MWMSAFYAQSQSVSAPSGLTFVKVEAGFEQDTIHAGFDSVELQAEWSELVIDGRVEGNVIKAYFDI